MLRQGNISRNYTNGKPDVKYSVNIPTFDLGDGKSIGIPISVGVSGGE